MRLRNHDYLLGALLVIGAFAAVFAQNPTQENKNQSEIGVTNQSSPAITFDTRIKWSTSELSDPVITIDSGTGEIVCNACEGVKPGTVIGTLTKKGRDSAFPKFTPLQIVPCSETITTGCMDTAKALAPSALTPASLRSCRERIRENFFKLCSTGACARMDIDNERLTPADCMTISPREREGYTREP